MKTLCLTSCALALWVAAFGQEELIFEGLYLEEGLSQSTVQGVFQDSRGFIWMGTQVGVNVYDGKRITVFQHDPNDPGSISQNEIIGIAEDLDGNMWFGGLNGLDKLDIVTGRFTNYKPAEWGGKENELEFVRSMVTARSGKIVFGASSGVWFFDPGTGEFTRLESDEESVAEVLGSNITRVFEDSEGLIWIGGRSNAFLSYDTVKGLFKRFDIPAKYLPQNDASPRFFRYSFTEDNFRRVVFSAHVYGAFYIDKISGDISPVNQSANAHVQDNALPILSLVQDKKGEFWYATYGGGLLRAFPDRDTFQIFNSELGTSGPGSDVFAEVIRDYSGLVWAASVDRGLIKIRRNKFVHMLHEPDEDFSLSAPVVSAMYIDSDGILWAGSLLGLDRIDREKRTKTRFVDLQGPQGTKKLQNISYIREFDKDSLLVAGIATGLLRVDKKTGRYQMLAELPMIISGEQDAAGNYWFAAITQGILFLDRVTGKSESFLSPGNGDIDFRGKICQSIDITPSGTLYIGTTSGLFSYDPASSAGTGYLSNPEDKNSLINNDVLTILAVSDDEIWLGTSGGLCKFVPSSGTFVSYTTDDGLPDNMVYAILQDRAGHFWLSTNNGLARFDAESGVFRNYSVSDGLQGTEFNQAAAFYSDAGEMFFGGMNGLNYFYPDIVDDSTFNPPIVITTLSFGEQDESPVVGRQSFPELTLPYDRRDVSMTFSGLDYAVPDKIRYQYFLDGYDKHWKEAGTVSFANYTNLSAGKYTFMVKCTNVDGRWGNNVATLPFKVLPPYWQTWWFRGVIGLLVLAAISSVFLLRIQYVIKQRDILRTKVDEATQELQRLATTDDLTGISNRRHFMEQAEKELNRMERYQRPMSLLMLDLDHFKKINDTHGHVVGDRTLKIFADKCKSVLRDTDIFGRVGGEEFAAILLESNVEKTKAVAERLRKEIEETEIVLETGERISFTVSIGLTMYRKSEPLTQVIARADNALYEAKASGRNRVILV